MYQYREPILEIGARIGITKEANKILSLEKKRQKKSKAQLLSDLIIEKYGNIKNKED